MDDFLKKCGWEIPLKMKDQIADRISALKKQALGAKDE